MDLLSVAAALYSFHHDVLRCDEREVLIKELCNDRFIDMKVIDKVYGKSDYGIGAEEAFRK